MTVKKKKFAVPQSAGVGYIVSKLSRNKSVSATALNVREKRMCALVSEASQRRQKRGLLTAHRQVIWRE